MRGALLGVFLLVPLAGLTVGACGGSAFDGTPAMGGTGGTGALAGTSSGVAGHPSGGAIGAGGSTSTAGATSSGGTHSAGGTVSGSAGSVGSAGSDLQACASNTDCEVVAVGCCGSCGGGPISNYTAINSKYDAQYRTRCGPIACGACPPTAFNPNDPTFYYVPTCKDGRCTVVDLNATDITACSTASDCSLRSGTACCSGCAGTPVALNTKHASELANYVCGSEPSACDACAPSFTGYAVDCASGRCSVVLGGTCTSEHPCPG